MSARSRIGLGMLIAAASAASLHGCNSTSGKLIPYLPASIGGSPSASNGTLSLTTNYFGAAGCGSSSVGLACGWQVQLSEAVVAVGPFYFYQSPPSSQGAATGAVLLQVTSQQLVDALDPTLYPIDGGANGETGAIESVQIGLFPPGCNGIASMDSSGGDQCGTDPTPQLDYATLVAEDMPESLMNLTYSGMSLSDYVEGAPGLVTGSSAFAAGTATEMLAALPPDGGSTPLLGADGSYLDGGLVSVPFYGFITIDKSVGVNGADVAAATLTSLQQVSGACPCPGGCSAGCSLDVNGTTTALQIRVDPSHWFDGVDFSLLLPRPTCPDGGSCATGRWWERDAGILTWNAAGPDSEANTSLVQEGLQQANGVYLFSLTSGGTN